MSMGGKGPEVLVTLTTDFGKVLDGIHRTKIRGGTHLATGIQIAGVCTCYLQGTGNSWLADTFPARAQASPEQIPTTTHHRLHLLTYRRG